MENLKFDRRIADVVLDAPVHNRSNLTVSPVPLETKESFAYAVFVPIVLNGNATTDVPSANGRATNPESDPKST